ncbi:unnamed protein product [Sympodiomycopsis kandeliae]
MELSVSFVTALAAAAGFASAAPTPAPEGQVMNINVEKRLIPGLLPDGIIDPPKIAQHINQVKAKYAQTSAAMAANSGNTKRASAVIPLTEQSGGSFWSGNVKIGGKSLSIDFDTGSADALVNYTPGSTATKTSKTFTNSYGTADAPETFKGTVYQDTFSVGSLSANKASIGRVESGGNIVEGANGLIGLAYPALSSFGSQYPPVFDTLINSGAVSQKVFGFALGPTGSASLTLGGLDNSKYTGSITYTSLSRQAYWQIPSTVNGQSVSSIVDSGTTLVIADTGSGSAQTFFKKLGVTTFTQDGVLYGAVNCDSPPAITFNFGGKNVQLTKAASIYGKTNDGRCVLSVVGSDVGQNAWINGDPTFLSSYVVFDRSRNAVGFASRS